MFAAQTSVVWALWVPSRHSLNNILFPSSLQKLGRIGCNHSLHKSTLRSSKRSLMAEYLLELKMYGRILSEKKRKVSQRKFRCSPQVCLRSSSPWLPPPFQSLSKGRIISKRLEWWLLHSPSKPGRTTEKSLGDPSEKGRVDHAYQWIPSSSGYQLLVCNLPL